MWMPLTTLVISCFREQLGAVRQQAITLANVDEYRCRHKVSVGLDEVSGRRVFEIAS